MNTALVTSLITDPVTELGLEIDAVEIIPAGRRHLLRITLDGDGPNGHGPDLDQITAATRAISRALDAATELGQQPYTLEVSSRGVHRPLTEPKHFRRNISRLVHCTLHPAVTITCPTDPDRTWTTSESQCLLDGRITAAADSFFEIASDTDAWRWQVPYAGVREAIVQVELNRPKAKTAKGKGEVA